MPRLKVTARSNSPFGAIDDTQHKFVIKVGTGLKGEKGEKGDRGDTGLINGATEVQVDTTTKVMFNGSSIPADAAASREVGIDKKDKIPSVGQVSEAFYSALSSGDSKAGSQHNANDFDFGRFYTNGDTLNGVDWGHITSEYTAGNGRFQTFRGVTKLDLKVRLKPNNSTWQPWQTLYHTGNTTKEAGTGYLVASSPVLKVQHNSFEKVHEAEQLDIDVQHLDTGVYAITGTTGLRDEGWSLKPPKDINGNVLCICETTQDGNVVTLKTYKKKFDFETVSIVADHEQPTDIPEGAEVMLRFNDVEVADVPIK